MRESRFETNEKVQEGSQGISELGIAAVAPFDDQTVFARIETVV